MTRPIITTLALLAGCLVLHGAKPAAAADDESRCRRPNIIFLMDDQHRCDHLGVVDPTVKTPALDRLAANGILFDQAVCQAPMCVPSRYSLMLGLYPPQIGIVSNGPGLSDAQLPCKPLPELLREAGYQTAGFGKTHWSAKGCSTRGFEVRYASTDPEQGAVLMAGDDPEGLHRYAAETQAFGGGEENIAGYLGCTSKVPEEDHRDGWALRRCLEFLDRGVDRKRPLFLYVSFLKPHAGHNVPPGFEQLYDLNAMPVPQQPPQELVEPCHATGVNREGMYRSFWSQATQTQWREMILRYRANCSWIDSMFGRILDRLKAKGLLENCLIVYISDHGEMLGERYYRFNKYCLFEHSVRVPLVLAGTAVPREKKGTRDHRPAELVDIVPTILEVAGIQGVSGKVGRSLLQTSTRKAAFCSFYDQPATAWFMWRTAEHKLILGLPKKRVQNGSARLEDVTAGELYDLKADPQEWHNFYTQPEYRVMRDEMSRGLLAYLNAVVLKRPSTGPAAMKPTP